MKKICGILQKSVVYTMIVLLIVNLFSNMGKRNTVSAHAAAGSTNRIIKEESCQGYKLQRPAESPRLSGVIPAALTNIIKTSQKTEPDNLIAAEKKQEIDLTDIRILYDKQENINLLPVMENGKEVYYLNDDARISFRITEYNWTEVNVNVITTEADSGRVEPLTPLSMTEPVDMDNPQNIMSVIYTQEGCYKTMIQGESTDGRKSNTYNRYFVIDKNAPRFQIQRKHNGSWENIEDKASYKDQGGQLLRFSVQDENHKTDSYQIKVTQITSGDKKPNITILGNDIKWQNGESSDIIYFENGDLFQEEGCYTVEITGQDKACNKPEEKTIINFVIDRSDPVISLIPESNIIEGAYYNEPVNVDFLIQESNIEGAEAAIDVVRRLDGKTYYETDEITRVLTLDSQETFFSHSCNNQGEYTITIHARDKAGNVSKQNVSDNEKEEGYTIHFIIDIEKPEIVIDGVPDQHKTRNPVALVFNAVDRNHDLDSYVIHVTRSSGDKVLESYDIKGEKQSAHDKGKGIWDVAGYVPGEEEKLTEKRQLVFAEEGMYEITFNGMDKAQNKADEKKISFYIDRTPPEIMDIQYYNADGRLQKKYYNIFSNKAILITFSVKDMVTGVDDQRVYVTVGMPSGKMKGETLFPAHKSADGRYYVCIPADLGEVEFDDSIVIWGSDALGNEKSITSENIVYNAFAPVIQMNCDLDYHVWTNKDVVFHTTVTDEKSGLKEVVYTVNNKVVKKIIFDQMIYTYEYDVTASESADNIDGYAVIVEVINNCGTSKVMKRQVFIDKAAPKVVLSGVQNGVHYKESQNFTTSVHDISYKKTKTVYVISRQQDGKIHTMSVAAFHSGKYDDSCRREMIKEGLYKIYAVATDGAGNKAVSNMITFVIDRTPPRISVSGVKDKTISGIPVTLHFVCEESFYASSQIKMQVEKSVDGEISKKEIKGFSPKAKEAVTHYTFSEDGIYKITLSASDKAGNIADDKVITFCVDQTKPVIHITGTKNYQQWDKPVMVQFSVEESNYSDNYVTIEGTRTDIDGRIEKIEVPQFVSRGKMSRLIKTFTEDGMYFLEIVSRDRAGNTERNQIRFTVDQTAPRIKNVEDYSGGYFQKFKLTDSLEEIFQDLTVISYRILLNGIEHNGTDEIAEEGKYNLCVEAEDELGHQSSMQIEFIIDHTAPKVIFNGPGMGQKVHTRGEITLTLLDMEDKITGVRMNGVDYGAKTRALQYSEYGFYKIEVDCEDKAGNTATETICFIYNNPSAGVWLLAGAGFVTVLIYIGIQIRRKRRNKRYGKSSGI